MRRMWMPVALLVAGAFMTACESQPAPKSQAKADELHLKVQESRQQFLRQDPSIQRFFNNSYAYAIFPDITVGGLGVGGGYGKGEVYQGNQFIGYSDVTQGNIGLQAGGQSFAQIVFFENPAAFASFRNGSLEFDAKASAVAANAGAAAAASYRKGVAVFALSKGGLMAQAAIGGQQFSFTPASSTGSAYERY